MVNSQEELSHQKDVFSQFCIHNSTMNVSEALKKELTLDKQEEQKSDPTWNDSCVAAMCHHVDADETQIKFEIT
jgi:hypothetical protein